MRYWTAAEILIGLLNAWTHRDQVAELLDFVPLPGSQSLSGFTSSLLFGQKNCRSGKSTTIAEVLDR